MTQVVRRSLWFTAALAVGTTVLLSQQSRRHLYMGDDDFAGLDRVIIQNKTQIEVLEREVGELRAWKSQVETTAAVSMATTAADFRELKVTVEHHERFLWLIITACALLVIESIYRILTGMQRKYGKPDDGL
jgi:uncharacterized membrane protein